MNSVNNVMVERKQLGLISVILLVVFGLGHELVFVESAHLFMSSVGVLSLWFLYELGIGGFEKLLVSQAEVVSSQFSQVVGIEQAVLGQLHECNIDRLSLGGVVLDQCLSSLSELSKAIHLNFQGLGNFFDLCIGEYLAFLYKEIAELKVFLCKITLYSLGYTNV